MGLFIGFVALKKPFVLALTPTQIASSTANHHVRIIGLRPMVRLDLITHMHGQCFCSI
jgi:hypothetical protein